MRIENMQAGKESKSRQECNQVAIKVRARIEKAARELMVEKQDHKQGRIAKIRKAIQLVRNQQVTKKRKFNCDRKQLKILNESEASYSTI